MRDYEELAITMRHNIEILEKEAEGYKIELDEILEKLDERIDVLHSKLELTDSQEDKLYELEDKYDFYEELRDRFDDVISDLISTSTTLI